MRLFGEERKQLVEIVSTQDRNGSLGANVVGERHALPRSCTTLVAERSPSPHASASACTSFILSRAIFSSLVGVFSDFFTKAWSIMTRLSPSLRSTGGQGRSVLLDPVNAQS